MQQAAVKLTKEKRLILISLFIILLYLSPLIVLGDNAHIRVQDNLDSNVAWYTVLTRSHELFGPLNAVIPQVMNGLPRGAYESEFRGIVWLYALFPTMTAYAISQTITRFAAFLGMYLLLKKRFLKEQDTSLIRVGVALAFALTPFWPSGMLSTLGQPLALWAFLKIRNREHSWREWTVLALLPLYSSFVLGFFFFLTAMGLLWLRDGIKKRDWNPVFFVGIAFMTAIYLAIDYRLLSGLALSSAPTSRTEFVESQNGFWYSMGLAVFNFLFGHNQVLTMHTPVILPIISIALIVVFNQKSQKVHKRILYLIGFNFALSLWYAFWFYKAWEPLKQRFSILTMFNFGRFHYLHPLTIYVSFALALYILWMLGGKWQKRVRFYVVAQVILLLFCNDEIVYRVYGQPSVKQFYAVNQFQQIRDYIGLPQESYRVASIGLHPSIAQYNGFYTLDSYVNYYPLTYKHEFRQIIAKELDKSPDLQTYFDQWGSRCYLFVSELGKNYEFTKNSIVKINHLQLNTAVLKAMGGKYILSAVPIMNAEEEGLQLLNIFDDPQSAWRIYLYEAK
ncbi:DUF6044 family protein [Cohnella candidum]|uniref:YkoS n=1 Tax=Cohnella candidum TaxID=2674991 RepID=A0A3G3JVY4_9BACL|nr:DUF6044 family protein [Cohnella candidum]AYQ72398.1 hypothetical protein EAV92_07315 [Cohnella candidum]